MFRLPWYRWGGAAAAGSLADYADIKMNPVSSRMTNSELLAAGLLLADSMGWMEDGHGVRGAEYAQAMRGGADWGAGMIAAGLVRRHLMPTVATTATTSTAAKSAAVTTPTTSTGVNASGGSAAFDLPNG